MAVKIEPAIIQERIRISKLYAVLKNLAPQKGAFEFILTQLHIILNHYVIQFPAPPSWCFLLLATTGSSVGLSDCFLAHAGTSWLLPASQWPTQGSLANT